jgi:DNA-binding IclR family transcriptional regulator
VRHAWLTTLSEEEALEAVIRQGFGEPAHLGPKAPTTFTSFPKMLQESRARGFSLLRDVHAVGTSAMAALSGDKGDRPRVLW